MAKTKKLSPPTWDEQNQRWKKVAYCNNMSKTFYSNHAKNNVKNKAPASPPRPLFLIPLLLVALSILCTP